MLVIQRAPTVRVVQTKSHLREGYEVGGSLAVVCFNSSMSFRKTKVSI